MKAIANEVPSPPRVRPQYEPMGIGRTNADVLTVTKAFMKQYKTDKLDLKRQKLHEKLKVIYE